MLLLPLTVPLVTSVARHMRAMDRAEILATRWDDDVADVARECATFSRFGQVAADDVGEPIAAVGGIEMWPGCWSVWMFSTDAWPRVALSVTRFVRRTLIPAIRATGATRAECRSIDGHHVAHRWLESLGAYREAAHPGYGRGGETFITFAWAPE